MYISSFLKLLDLTLIDKRALGGCLWVIADNEKFAPIKAILNNRGITFHYCENSRAVHRQFGQYKPAWWTTYNEDPISQRKVISSLLYDLILGKTQQYDLHSTGGNNVFLSMLEESDGESSLAGPPSDSPCEIDAENKEIKRICNSCAYIHDCSDAFAFYAVGCDKYILSLGYAKLTGQAMEGIPVLEQPIEIKSRDFWFKVVDFLQQNWALIDENADKTCTVYFLGDRGDVFDIMRFPSKEIAIDGLQRNGFNLLAQDSDASKFLTPPLSPFAWREHPNGRIYSSGEYWEWYPASGKADRQEVVALNYLTGNRCKVVRGNSQLSHHYDELHKQGYLSVAFMQCGKSGLLSEGYEANIPLARIQGALIGGAVGDALGRAVEGKNPDGAVIDAYIPWYGWTDGPAGTITDDTQMTMWLAESLVQKDGLSPVDIAYRFTSQHIRGIGSATREFVTNFKDKGKPWYLAGVQSSGNGAAMRAAPVGLYYRNHQAEVKLAAGLQAVITHNDPMAIASSIIMACLTAWLVFVDNHRLESIESRLKLCSELAELIEGIEDKVDYRCRKSGQPSKLYTRIRRDIPCFLKKGATPAAVQQAFWSGAYVLESLPFALYCFLYSPADFRITLLNAVNESRDSDTVASMACTLSGTYNGIAAIPEYYRDGKNLECCVELLELGEKLYRNT